MILITILGLGSACTENGTRATSPPPTVSSAPKAPSIPHLQGFPDIVMTTQTSFAHNYGNRTTLEQVTVAGAPCEPSQVLERWVAHHKGWGTAGDFTEQTALAVATRFFMAWATEMKWGKKPFLTEADTQLIRSLEQQHKTFHPLTSSVQSLRGDRWVVVSAFSYDSTDSRGNHFSHVVRAFRVTDGQEGPAPDESGGLPISPHR